jgi:hypothetical protein
MSSFIDTSADKTTKEGEELVEDDYKASQPDGSNLAPVRETELADKAKGHTHDSTPDDSC